MSRSAPETLICDRPGLPLPLVLNAFSSVCDVDVQRALVPSAIVVHIPNHPHRAMYKCSFHSPLPNRPLHRH